MTKTQKYFQDMLAQNKELFDRFQTIHEKYVQDAKTHQGEFNQIGLDVQDIIRRYENLLCSQSEGSGYGKYSSKLAEKFQAEIKKVFPKVDFIGAIIR